MPRKKSKKVIIDKHNLMPKHKKCSDKEKKQILEKYNATVKELPKIKPDDAGIANLDVGPGDMIKIERNDPLTGMTLFYRVVSNE